MDQAKQRSPVCALCLQPGPVVESHLLPAGLYRLMRDEGGKNPNPVFVTGDTSLQTASQMKAPLLCRDCEDRFNNGGERWILQNCFRGPGEFRLHDALNAAKPLGLLTGGGAVYAGAQIPEVNMDALVYFAASVVWRGAARGRRFAPRSQLSLGPYNEDFRLYLLGLRDFPASAAVWVNAWTSPMSLSCSPNTAPGEGFRHHYFVIPGITFHVFVGQRIPSGLRVGCAARSPERMILLLDEMNGAMMKGVVRTVIASRAAGKLRGPYGLPAMFRA